MAGGPLCCSTLPDPRVDPRVDPNAAVPDSTYRTTPSSAPLFLPGDWKKNGYLERCVFLPVVLLAPGDAERTKTKDTSALLKGREGKLEGGAELERQDDLYPRCSSQAQQRRRGSGLQ